MESVRDLQTILDTNAEGVHENDYLKMCNHLKGLYDVFKKHDKLKKYTNEMDINILEDRLTEINEQINKESQQLWKFKVAKKISPRVLEWLWDKCDDTKDYSIMGKTVEEFNNQAVEEYNKNISQQRLVHVKNIVNLKIERKDLYKDIGIYYMYNEGIEC